jgi:hypothetical protein
VDPIFHSRPQPHQKNALPKQFALIAYLARWNPYFRQSPISKQNRQRSVEEIEVRLATLEQAALQGNQK